MARERKARVATVTPLRPGPSVLGRGRVSEVQRVRMPSRRPSMSSTTSATRA